MITLHCWHYGKDWMLKKMINDENTVVRPIHYLGSKLRMLDTVREAVDAVDPTCGPICDLFSGSGTVSKYFVNYRSVISADIQVYSSVLCDAEMNFLNEKIDVNSFINSIIQSKHRKMLIGLFEDLLNYEQESIEKAKEGEIERLYEIIEKGSIYIFDSEETVERSITLEQQLESLIINLKSHKCEHSVESMITRYYGGLYFSYKQAIDLDCIEHFVFKTEGIKKNKLLAALLSTTSEIVNTVGKQFAQPLKVSNGKGQYKKSLLKKIIDDRSLDVFSIYRRWLIYYLSIEENKNSFDIICDDYVRVLERLKDKSVSVIYADPPYTRYHYSRYYHVLETICLRDNPKITTTFPNGAGGISRAIYREGRHQSPFCIKSKAEDAFEKLFIGVKELNMPLVLSYSPFDPSQAVTPRLQTVDQLMNKAGRYFSEVSSISPGEFTHSKLNSVENNFGSNHEAELLILCRN